ncbi:hypothetical protein IFU19_03070 [Microbacterium sp. CFBP 8794]|nr:citrate/2-methylcitrate synthase [Microbacterium sp. CFBP 8794]MBD8477164.1 hypothetical protein [Microbacterium sp. CFBP 8794]
MARLSPCAGEPTAYDNLLSIHAGGQGVRRSRPHERHSHDPGYRDDPRRPHEHGPAVRAINAALILLIDHDLAVSTFAARVAASARADGYAAVGAALGAADSPLHIAAATRTSRLLTQVRRGREPERALADAVQDGNGIPGFGHPLYSGVDDRADALFPLLAQLPDGERTMDAVTRLSDTVAARAHARPNVDLALAALASGARLPDDAASSIFVVGRLAGWIAHIAAEYAEAPMRLRPRGEYVGP